MHVVLVAPEIATNTGNIIRLCANTGSTLHLVEPLGFSMDDRLLRRAGLDYHEFANVVRWPDVAACVAALGESRRFTFSSHATQTYSSVAFRADDVFIFGAERAGLSADQLNDAGSAVALRIPMQPSSRSLNLANAVAIVVYEAWRQIGFPSAGANGSATSETPAATPFDH